MKNTNKKYKYDEAFSFAGENREYINKVANILLDKGVKVFYDNFEEANLWGKDLAAHFDYIYNEESRYVVIFVSKSYKEKRWTRHELRMALQRALGQKEEYIVNPYYQLIHLDISNLCLKTRRQFHHFCIFMV
jgi:hypothetical protein